MNNPQNTSTPSSKEWWDSKRYTYNKGLIIAGLMAFILYVILGATLIMPYDKEFEINLFTIIFQGFGYLMVIAMANILYSLGYLVDSILNKNNNKRFRKNLFRLGYWFSCGLPFLVPAMIIFMYFNEFSHLSLTD